MYEYCKTKLNNFYEQYLKFKYNEDLAYIIRSLYDNFITEISYKIN